MTNDKPNLTDSHFAELMGNQFGDLLKPKKFYPNISVEYSPTKEEWEEIAEAIWIGALEGGSNHWIAYIHTGGHDLKTGSDIVDSNFEIVIHEDNGSYYGYGTEEENIKKLVKELGLEAQVMFFKDISENLKNALISKSNIFVMPSIKYKTSVEGFGIAYVEAAQYGIPSIGGKDGGAADAIDHDKTGLICDGDNLDEIYSSLNLMLENKKFIEFGKNAKLNSDKFLWSNIIENYKKILV